jgi:hypothetical protein
MLSTVQSSRNWSAARLRFPELVHLHRPDTAQHLVQFYDDDTFVIKTASHLVAQALVEASSVVIIATEFHLRQITAELATFRLDIEAYRKAGHYVTCDAADALARCMVEGSPDQTAFDRAIGDTMCEAAKNSATGFVFAFGEMVALLSAANDLEGAVRLEQLWNNLARRQRFSLYCAYPLGSLETTANVDALTRICTEHTLTIPSENFV